MWKYIKQYLVIAVIAGLFMVGEVLMDLVQPGIMSRIVRLPQQCVRTYFQPEYRQRDKEGLFPPDP